MGDYSAVVSFVADVSNFARNVGAAQTKTQKFASSVESASRKASLVLGGLAGAAVLAAKAAIEDEASASKLAQTLNKVTGATDKQIDAVEKYITKTTLATGVTDGELRESLSKLTVATKSTTEAQKLQNLALDISAATGKDLGAVTDSLVKAQNGSFTSLKKLGVPLDENIIKSKDFEAAQKELAKTFGGASAKAAETNAGKMKRFQIAMAEAQETLGSALLPYVSSLAGILSKLAPKIEENKDLIFKVAIVVGVLASAIVALNAAFKVWIILTQAWSAVTKIATAVQAAYNFVLALNPITLIVIAIVALIAILAIAWQKSDKFREVVSNAFQKTKDFAVKAFEGIVNFVKSLPEKLVAIGKTIINALTTPYRVAFLGIAKLWNMTVGKINFEIPDWVPGIGGKGFSFPKLPEVIPALANGGIVTKPTLALVGEAGAEAVVPLNQYRNGGGGTTIINVNGSLLDPEGTARAINRALVNSKRRAGAF